MFPLVIILFVPLVTVSLLQWVLKRLFMTRCDTKDKLVLITGASGGLGEACAKRFASSGSKVALCARNVTELNRVKNEIVEQGTTHEPLVYAMDVTKAEDIETTIQELEGEHGPVDIVVSNAGVSQRGSVSESIIDVHHNLMKINYFGQVNLVKAILPSMLKRNAGHIVSVGSVQGQIAIPFRSAYAASKHAAQAFFDSLRSEVAENNINVTVVNPGYIRTNLSKNAVSSDGSKHGVLDKTTASGMPPSSVAEVIFSAVEYYTKEISLADVKSNVATYIRTLFPPVYFKIMEMRAASERRKLQKDS